MFAKFHEKANDGAEVKKRESNSGATEEVMSTGGGGGDGDDGNDSSMAETGVPDNLKRDLKEMLDMWRWNRLATLMKNSPNAKRWIDSTEDDDYDEDVAKRSRARTLVEYDKRAPARNPYYRLRYQLFKKNVGSKLRSRLLNEID